MTGSGDVIATLSSRVSELSKRVVLLQADLEAAQKRVAFYEENDTTVQEALSSALRAAYTIRERAETTAGQILEQAREERRMLLKEIERLREERDAIQEEIAERRRSGIAAVAPRPLTSDSAAMELRAVASEALRGLFQEIVDDIRAEARPAPAAPPPPPAPTAPLAAAATEAPERPLRAPEAPRVAEAIPQVPTYEHMSRVRRTGQLAEEEELEAPPDVSATPTAETIPAFESAPAAETTPAATAEAAAPAGEPAPAPVAEAPEPAPAPAAQASQVTPPPLELVPPHVEIEEIAPTRVEAASPTSDIQLVLSPIASFPRLVEIERHIQALPVVRTLYVRDFRGGVATLAVALRSAMTPEEFAGVLGGLARPRMRLVSGSRNTIELRVEGEASIA